MEDARTLEHCRQARVEYYRLFKGCSFRRCFYCGEFFRVERNRINSLKATVMYCSEACHKAMLKLQNKMHYQKRSEAKAKLNVEYDWILDMSTWEWTPKNA